MVHEAGPPHGRSHRRISRPPPPPRTSPGRRPSRGRRRPPWRGQRRACRGESVPHRQPRRIIVGDPDAAARIFPDERLQWQVDAGSLVGLHQWRSCRRIAEDQQLGRSKWHADGRGAGGMVDARKDRDALGLQAGLQAVDRHLDRVTAPHAHQAGCIHGHDCRPRNPMSRAAASGQHATTVPTIPVPSRGRPSSSVSIRCARRHGR